MKHLVIGECDCHYWVMVAGQNLGRCGECRQKPKIIGDATPEATSVRKPNERHDLPELRVPNES